ncbi:CHAP domain-containing protein [Acrocarpospora corrugata]|uniref:CHAP domain-containing protein n=1 Tax=Acrocarpospora corrugata TaxID=35763 RepID=UPI001FE55543|nr:CHAP domain-containing protein [Acrocarpospora corrugata]
MRVALVTTLIAGAALTGSTAAAGIARAEAHPEGVTSAAGAPADFHPDASPLLKIAQRLPKVRADQVLKLAESQVGVSENHRGGGTPYHHWYMNTPRAKETLARDGGATVREYGNAAWCDMFVSWVGDRLGIRPTMGWDAYTVSHADWFKSNKRWGTQPTPGAVVFFGWNGGKDLHNIDHVGFVIKDNGDGTIKTVEGNTGGGKVEIRTRPTAEVVGYGYPVYAT